MTSTTEKITSQIFVLESYAQDDIKDQGITAGDKLPLKLTWREAVKQTDGTYKVHAFFQKANEKATDITEAVLGTNTVIETDINVRKSFSNFNSAYGLNENDVFTGELTPDMPISEAQIMSQRTKYTSLEAA